MTGSALPPKFQSDPQLSTKIKGNKRVRDDVSLCVSLNGNSPVKEFERRTEAAEGGACVIRMKNGKGGKLFR